ncbi:cation:proton antiporter [Rhizobium lusitanum]|uniref:Kef-type K+ transport system membrane component KefB/nucleotide-binding universal stress UspA family protein n=1 Tax=Rhizobium lusitanum TaxID=293958 RepID=A0A7X0MD28_9HYPH|nr:cation:proton antiporter [Rhizobium lusitanum]MBB6484540.1 Kef-type K+ transport system membrane component KefB/nucleotide-binding universal stress UspA family protein [Rhizobium lusitanum]
MSSRQNCIKSFSSNVLIIAIAIILSLSIAQTALAAEGQKASHPSEGLFLAQIVLLVVSGRLLGELMVRFGQPSIMGQIIAGIILGPSLFGLAFPHAQASLFPSNEAQKSMADAVAQLGILFLLLLAGMETDLGLAKRLRKSAAGVSLAGIVIPFAAGFALGELIPDSLLPDPQKRLVTSLFLGTALSISSVKIVASVVREMDFMRRNIGQLIVASAIIDDTVGWVIIAITFGLAEKGMVDLTTLATSVVGTLAFMAVSFTVGRRIVFEIIRWTNDNFRSDLPVLSAIIAIMGAMAIITNLIGVHTVLGAFVAGILVGESPILTRQIDVQLRGLTTALFMPAFFGLTGLQTDLTVLADPSILLLTAAVVIIASVGKFGGAFAAAKISGYSGSEALALGCGMNARGSTEVIVATIGLSVGVLDEKLFSVVVAMAVITTMAMPPTLRWALARLPLRKEERDRLEREEFESESFLGNFERILLTVDGSQSSRLAAWIAAFFTVTRRMPITVLDVRAPIDESEEREMASANGQQVPPQSRTIAQELREFATDLLSAAAPDAGLTAASDIHITVRDRNGELETVLSDISSTGHDLLLTGVEPSMGQDGRFSRPLQIMTSAFKGTSAIVSARGPLPERPRDLRILLPVSGTERSIRAAEFGLAIAKAAGAHCALLLIVEPRQVRAIPRISDRGSDHQDVLKIVGEIADYYGVEVEKVIQEGPSPELSILRHARSGRYNLVVLGVSKRASGGLSYGSVADTLLQTADRSCIFIETDLAPNAVLPNQS